MNLPLDLNTAIPEAGLASEFPGVDTGTILIVDDDDVVREVLVQGLVMAGFHCLAAESGQQALAILEETPVEVVITDIIMPEMNGIELIRRIKEKHHAAVIAMTGYVENYTYETIISEGASDFIQKPVRIAEFVARLRRVLREHSTLAQRDRAEKRLKENLDVLHRTLEGIVQAISLTVEMRDPYTAGHQERVASLACAIGRGMGLDEDRLYGLKVASTIHDMGKLAIPAEILVKPGRLSPIEYQLIQNHVQAGYDILKKIEFPWPVAQIIYQHHERMDGSGYPQGLKGDGILLEARILAVADAFETIISHRPYRPSLGYDRAREELLKHNGTLYDPQVVAVCLALFAENRFRF